MTDRRDAFADWDAADGTAGDQAGFGDALGVVRAPEINRSGITWFNVEAPLSLADLAGRLVILDFWTFCCVNCLHVLDTLHAIEEAFPEEVAVIGVHSPKFEAEKDPTKLRDAVMRHGIRHPVAHDPEKQLWDQYAVRAWPTLVFLSPQGTVIGMHSGEPELNTALRAINEVLEKFKIEGLIEPVAMELRPERPMHRHFAFPTKIKPVQIGGETCWALTDSGHHQIVLLNNDGAEIQRFGSGAAGFSDGPAERASFRNPQGLIGAEGCLYIADTGNHAIRIIDLEADQVATLAGTGIRGPALPATSEPSTETALASPWDLALSDDQLYFANAGTHQIGVVDISDLTVFALAGAGGENLVDGPPEKALLAQPSALMLTDDDEMMIFADAESSAIRTLDLGRNPVVNTIVGRGLFSFGHENGRFADALMQHPMGLADGGERRIYVADSYNDTIRVIDVVSGEVTDLDTDDHPRGAFECLDKVCTPLREPAGIYADGPYRLLVVDTGNHRVVEYNLSKRTYHSWAG